MSVGGCWGTCEMLDDRPNVKPPKYTLVEKPQSCLTEMQLWIGAIPLLTDQCAPRGIVPLKVLRNTVVASCECITLCYKVHA